MFELVERTTVVPSNAGLALDINDRLKLVTTILVETYTLSQPVIVRKVSFTIVDVL
jgi:hypothetical protein